MPRTYVHAKLHGIRVTELKLNYNGSAEIDRALLKAAGIDAYEQIQIVNTNNAERMITYAFPGEPGAFTLNGAAARLGAEGDECLVIAYRQEEKFSGAKVLMIDPKDNTVREELNYEPIEL